MKQKTILITGGAGFVGSHVNKMLNKQGYQTIVFDNLSRGNIKAVRYGTFVKGDLGNATELDQLFTKHHIDALMHFAALIDVRESVVDPAKYYINNFSYTLNLLEAMRKHNVKIFIFSSSAAVYGYPQRERISETHPCNPINPYGKTKLMVEHCLQDYNKAYGLKYVSLRYFNAAGGDPDGEIKNYQSKPTNLIPIALQSLKSKDGSLTIHGTDYPTPDGTCVRDYVHVNDLGNAHILALEKLLSGGNSESYNLGNEKGCSVREVVEAIESVTSKKVNVIEGPPRAGDPPFLIAESKKVRKELGWQPNFPDLDSMITHAWKALDFSINP
jgi:UDP-glucose 4-epimerase